MKPRDTLKKTMDYLDNLEKAKRLSVVVGLPKGEATSKIYGDGINVVDVGTFHEFAITKPQRSFLRVPFTIKDKEITKTLIDLFRDIAEKGADAETQLAKAGIFFENISKEAFETKGYGTWEDISPGTKIAKGSSAILIDTGILRGSITSEVRGQ